MFVRLGNIWFPLVCEGLLIVFCSVEQQNHVNTAPEALFFML